MIKPLIFATALSITTMINATVAFANNAPVQKVNGIAAIVNKTVITDSEVNQTQAQIKAQMQAAHAPIPGDDTLRKQVIDHLINQELIKQIAKKANVTVSSHDMAMALNSVAAQNHLTVAGLKQKIAASGQSFAEFSQQLKQQVLISKVQQQAVASTVHVSDHDINQFMAKANAANNAAKSYHLADILIPVDENASKLQWANAQNRAKEVYTKLKKGGNYKQLAKLESGGANALNGGDMGWHSSDDLPDLFVTQLQQLKPGQVSPPVKAANGFHILKLIDVKAADHKLTREQAKQILEQKAFEQAVVNWLKKLKKSAYIKIM